MPYGELRVDTITFTNGGVDKSITVSGLFASTSGNLTVTGTVSGNTANFVSGVFTTQISGTTITGTTVAATTGTFTTVTGGVATITSGVFAVGSAAAPSISFSSDSNTGIYSPGGDQVAISTNGIGRLFVNSSGNLLLGTATDGSFNRNIVLEGTSSAGVMFRAGGAFKGFFYVDTSNAVLGASTGDIILKPADTERLRITSAGLVGIGTSSVSRTLDVVSTDTWIRTARTGGNAWIVGTGVQDAYRIYDDTAGVERFRIDTSGRVGIGTTSPSETLHVVGTAQASQFKSAGGAGATGYDFSASGSGAGVANIFCPSGFTLGFGTNSLERARIDSSGRLLVGTSTARTGFFNTTINNAFVQVETTSQELIGYTAVVNSNTQYGPVMLLGKSRGATTNSATAVSNGDTLGLLSFQGADGSQLVEGASIAAYVDGTPGADDLPTRLVLSTTADGASSPTERMRIDSSGRVGIGTSPDSRLHVVDSSGNSIRIGYLPGTNNFNIYDAGAHLFRSSGGITEYARIDTSGRLGVGTSSPSTKLQIGASSADGVTIDFNGGIATGSEYTNLRFTASAYGFVGAEIRGIHTNGGTNLGVLAFHTSGSERLRITSAGLVGVGTSAPTVRLQVQDSIAGGSDGTVATLHNFSDAGGDARYVGLNFRIGSDNGTSAIRAARTLSAADYRTELSFWTNPTGATQTPVRAMTIDYLQRVGIGTTSPGALLHLAQSAADAVARIDGGSSSTAFIDFRIAGANKSYVGLGGLTGGSNNDLINYNSSAGNWIAYTNGSERLRITSAGLVGIGVSSVGAQLDVYNSQASGISEVARLRWNNGGTGGALTYANQSGTVLGQIANVTSASGVELAFSTYNNSTALGERMRLTSTGLGIGNTAPGDMLTVGTNSAGGNIRINSSSAGNNGVLRFFASDAAEKMQLTATTTDAVLYTPAGISLSLQVANSERARIDSSGRLLVGTSSTVRDSRLCVRGNASGTFTGDLELGAAAGFASIASGNSIGVLRFTESTNGGIFAQIYTEADATPGNNDYPGRLVFSTTADGASSPTERMRITNAGNVGIGTTSPSTRLHLQGTSATYIQITDEGDGASRIGQNGTALTFGVDLADGSTERARIDSSGRLLVGTSTAQGDGRIQVQGSNVQSKLTMWRDNAPFGFIDGTAGSSIEFGASPSSGVFGIGASIQFFGDQTWGANDYPGRLVFSTTADGASSPTERMRIRNGGDTGIFCDANSDVLYLSATAAAGTSRYLLIGKHSATGTIISGTISLLVFTNGNIQNTNNSYAGISDIKLKENVVDAASQWDDIKALQVRKYNFKEETGQQTHTQIGLIAQEVELVSPGLVSESPDRDAEGNDLGTVTKSVNYSVLYMKAVKALQEAMERIETLEAKVAALEGA